jgi:alpha-1,3-rhamnosyl/mannosyltransferase
MPRTPVVFNAQALSRSGAETGVGTFIRGLLGGLARRDDLELVAMSQSDLALPEGVGRQRVHRVHTRPRIDVVQQAALTPFDRMRAPTRGWVFHNTDFHAPPLMRPPWVQTLFDVTPLLLDDPDQAVLRARWKRFGPRYRQASAVVAISHHAAREGTEVLGLDPARVHVAHLGVEPTFAPADRHDWRDRDERDEREPPYLLIVSDFTENKGFKEAFAVLDELADAGFPHRLVVAGPLREWSQDRLFALRDGARHPDRIDIRGFVPDLVALYQQAAVYVMASRSEGFGLTALEAMACGVPVVAFSNSAVTEVVGGGGELVADGDVVAMTAAVRGLLEDAGRWAEVRDRGIAHARSFTWDACAAVHAEVYRAVSALGD